MVLKVAREGEAATPRIPSPPALRPLLNFAPERLRAKALATIRRAVDADDELRQRALETVVEDGSPRASWIFLRRPEGWEAELEAIAAEQAAGVGAVQSEAEERTAQRKLRATQESMAKVEATLAKRRAELDAATAALAAERQVRRAADDKAAALERKVASLEGERDSARRRAQELTDRLSAVEADLAGAQAALAAAGERFDPSAVAELVAGTAVSAAELAESLAAATEILRAATSAAAGADGSSADCHRIDIESATTGTEAGTMGAGGEARGHRPERRQPVQLPPAVLDDSPEAAAHLMRAGGAILLVDGYNATLSTWPSLTITEQRHRLVDALAELASRTGVEPTVVFDGPDHAIGAPGQPRRPVKIRFSGAGVEADDVIIALVAELPVRRPVIVASDDRRVREGAGDRGANVISIDQLFATLGRER